MKILSLFDGMSVAQQALKNIGADVEVYYASEIDEYAKAVTQSNFPNTIQVGSVTELKGKDFTDIDLIVGGSPCTDLSIAKKGRQGLEGSQSKLFYDYVRLVKEIGPKFFILENVASMAKDQKEIMEKELFGIKATMINASLVSAQNRKRIFIVGKRIDWYDEISHNFAYHTYEQVEIPQPEDRGILLKDIVETGENIVYQDTYKRMEGKPREHTDKCFTLTSAMGTGGGHVPYVVKGCASRTYPRTKNEGVERQKQIEIRDDEKANAMTSVQSDSMVMQDMQIRKLTPIECLRLQSMPDDYFDKALYKGKPISNTQRYKMCGNAFNCAVIEHILKQII